MGKIKDLAIDKMNELSETGQISIEIPIVDFVPNDTIDNIRVISYVEAQKILSDTIDNFSKNNFTFEYEFICRVKAKKKL